MSVALVGAAMASATLLQSCGVMSSAQCAARAKCTEPDTGLPLAQPVSDGDIVGMDPQTRETAAAPSSSEDGAATNPLVDAAAAATDGARASAGATSHDAGQSTGNDAAIGNPSNDGAVKDVAVDTGTVGPPDDAAVDDVASPACDPNSCPPCVPYFLSCCTLGGTCGCSLLFPPGPCN
jgi:hypothetical protein